MINTIIQTTSFVKGFSKKIFGCIEYRDDSSEYLPSPTKARGSSPRTPVTFCTDKKSPKSRQGGFAPSGHPHSSWAGGARECLRCLDSALPPNFCALQWQDWQLSILRLPALHVEVPAGLRSRCAMRTRQEICPVRTMPVARKSLKRIVLLGGEPNEED